MKIYPYVNKTRANADGTFPVYFIIKTKHGRFFVNTGITTCDRLVKMSFPKSDPNWKCWRYERIHDMTNTLPRVVYFAGCRDVVI